MRKKEKSDSMIVARDGHEIRCRPGIVDAEVDLFTGASRRTTDEMARRLA